MGDERVPLACRSPKPCALTGGRYALAFDQALEAVVEPVWQTRACGRWLMGEKMLMPDGHNRREGFSGNFGALYISLGNILLAGGAQAGPGSCWCALRVLRRADHDLDQAASLQIVRLQGCYRGVMRRGDGGVHAVDRFARVAGQCAAAIAIHPVLA